MAKKKTLELAPIKFNVIYKEKPWGGDGFKKILKRKSPSMAGESIEMTQQPKDVSVVAEGAMKGMTLNDLMQEWPTEILGDDQALRFSTYFPVMIKFLYVDERLSLQVHPNDEFASQHEPEGRGKTEVWYVLHAEKDAKAIRGVLPGTTIAEFKDHLDNGTIEECLNVMDLKTGDVIFIPPGTIHTAYGGALFLEIQQNSDVTYRVHDWGRMGLNKKPRALHFDKAMEVIDFYSMGVSKFKMSRISGYAYNRKLLMKCEKFTAELVDVGKKKIKIEGNRDRFHLITVVAGKGLVQFGDKQKCEMEIGETYLIPAHLGDYEVSTRGTFRYVETYVQ